MTIILREVRGIHESMISLSDPMFLRVSILLPCQLSQIVSSIIMPNIILTSTHNNYHVHNSYMHVVLSHNSDPWLCNTQCQFTIILELSIQHIIIVLHFIFKRRQRVKECTLHVAQLLHNGDTCN